MERESFESDSVARLLNEHFVSIKVDREERPDVDKVYMTYIQATSGGGGWPMSVFLTPDLAPFFGGTYFPPNDYQGRPGFHTVLRRIADVWANDKEAIKQRSEEVIEQLDHLSKNASAEDNVPEGGQLLSAKEREAAITACAGQLAQRFDAIHGGFGPAPKFPRPSELLLLFTHHARLMAAGDTSQAQKVLHMATFTLDKMQQGGIRDHLGGGFHRYSVDER